MAASLTAACPEDRFTAIYARTPTALLAAAADRADCLAGNAYAQGGVTCPPPVCGNRIRESGEECDDGNAADGDGCSANCLREAPATLAVM
ncbi:DUF4215 domain-containing protein [bacterium]|nr:DUF4215 domain-containing protein [bacterium]